MMQGSAMSTWEKSSAAFTQVLGLATVASPGHCSYCTRHMSDTMSVPANSGRQDSHLCVRSDASLVRQRLEQIRWPTVKPLREVDAARPRLLWRRRLHSSGHARHQATSSSFTGRQQPAERVPATGPCVHMKQRVPAVVFSRTGGAYLPLAKNLPYKYR